jgi:hypothetical protein
MSKEQTTLTFAEGDLFNRQPFCENLERYLLVEKDYVEGSLVVSLNAGFGSGKTTFLDMWKNDLTTRRKAGNFDPLPISLNAWENDFCGDPLLSVLTGMIDALDQWNPKDAKEKKNTLIEATKDIGWFTLGLANGVTSKVGINAVAAGNLAEQKKEKRAADAPKNPDFITAYQERTSAFKNLKAAITKVFGGPSAKAIIFVDELDRCRPDFAIDYLETIKHVFDIEGLIFVLAIDQQQLANSAKSLFGQDLNFPEYYRKFSHRTIDLPKPEEQNLKHLTTEYAKKYLSIEGTRHSGIKIDSHRIEQITELLFGFDVNPRQAKEIFRTVGHALSCTKEDEGRILWAYGVSVVFFAVIKTVDDILYKQFRNESISIDQVATLLNQKLDTEKAYWWFRAYITGSNRIQKGNINIATMLKKHKFIATTNAFDGSNELGQFSHGWQDSNIANVFQRLDAIETSLA